MVPSQPMMASVSFMLPLIACIIRFCSYISRQMRRSATVFHVQNFVHALHVYAQVLKMQHWLSCADELAKWRECLRWALIRNKKYISHWKEFIIWLMRDSWIYKLSFTYNLFPIAILDWDDEIFLIHSTSLHLFTNPAHILTSLQGSWNQQIWELYGPWLPSEQLA